MISQGLPRAKSKPPTERFSRIPDPIARRRDLTDGAKCLFGLLAAFEASTGRPCTLPNEQLAERTGQCTKTVKSHLKALEGEGLIVREMRGRGRVCIRIVPHGETLSPSICSGGETPSPLTGKVLPLARGNSCPAIGEGENHLRLFAGAPDEEETPDEPLPPGWNWKAMARADMATRGVPDA